MTKASYLKTILGASVFGLAGISLAACGETAAAPDLAPVTEPAATDATFSDDGVAALEARMGQYVAERAVYGIHTRLVHKGEVVSDFKAGLRGLQAGAPIEDDTIYRIYSMTKPVTGVAMMMLWEEGKFSLDDPVTKFIPEFENLRVLEGVNEDGTPKLVDATRAPTMREVMSHTAGFAYGLSGTDLANAAFRDNDILRAPDLQTFIDRVADVPLLFQPGEAWAYSAAVDVQGYLVETLSGQSFGTFLDTRIFTPLGMDDTGFYVPDADYARFSEIYGYHPETGQLVPVPYPNVQFRKETIAMESGGGGLISTMDDYSAFAQMLLSEGALNGVQLLKPETVQLMQRNVLPDGVHLSSLGQNSGEVSYGTGFGLGLGLLLDPELAEQPHAKGSYFWSGAAGTWFWVDPENDLFFIGMVQIFDQGGASIDARETAAELVYQGLEQ